MRLYNASSRTPLALPPSSGFKYKAPRNYLPEQSSIGKDFRRMSKMLIVGNRLPCQSPVPHSRSSTSNNRRYVGPSLSEIASSSSTILDLGRVHHANASFLFDIDEKCVRDSSPIWISDDETFSRSTSSTISSVIPVYQSGRYRLLGAKTDHARQVFEDTSWDSPSFASGDAWWEGSAVSTNSSPHWHVRRRTVAVKDLSHKVLSHERGSCQYNTPATRRNGVDRAMSSNPTALAAERPGRFVVSTFDEWETFDTRFDDEDDVFPSNEIATKGRGCAKAMNASVEPYGTDIRKERYRIRECDTATTCDTSNSSKQEQEEVSAIKIGPVQRGVSKVSEVPRRRVPVLLGHILEEKFQQTRRRRETKTTIDEIGFPLSENGPDSMMLVMKNDDKSCSLATTYVRAMCGQWSEIVSL